MSFHRKHAQFEHARWRKAFLLPVWLVQVALLLGLMGIFAYRLAETIQHYEENDKKGKLPVIEVVWESTNVGFSLLSLVLTLLEVSRLFAETLTPFFLLASNIIKTTCAGAILGLDIVVYIHRSEGNWSIVGLAVDCGLFASVLALCIYSIVAYRRLISAEAYRATDVKAFGFDDGYDEITMSGAAPGPPGGGAIDDDPFIGTGPGRRYEDRPYGGPAGPSFVATPYSAYEPRLAAQRAAARTPPPPSPPQGGSGDPAERTNYSHERDTQFDAYRQRATSSAALSREAIDEALGAELWRAGGSGSGGGGGGGSGHGHGSAAENISPIMDRAVAFDRMGSVTGVGVVRSQVVQRPLQVNRTPSWSVEQHLVRAESDLGRAGHGGGGGGGGGGGKVATIAEEGHSGGGRAAAVPTAADGDDDDDDEEEDDTLFPHQRRAPGSGDRALLLGHGRHNSEDDDAAGHGPAHATAPDDELHLT